MTNGENSALGFGLNDRSPLTQASNAPSAGSGDPPAGVEGSGTVGSTGVVSAVFDHNEQAQNAVRDLRAIGIDDGDLSIIAQSRGTMTTREGSGDIVDEEHSNILRGILGGGALGAGLGVVALAIPGVGPLAALGAIAASAVPEAVAIGAVAGAAAGSFNEALKSHGVSDADSAYYGERLKEGGVLVTVSAISVDRQQAEQILHRNGGHSSSRPHVAAM